MTKRKYESRYCSSCGGTGESWNPMVGLFDGPCLGCKGEGIVMVRIEPEVSRVH